MQSLEIFMQMRSKLKTHFDFHVLDSDKISGSHLFDTSLASCLSGSQAFTFSVVFRVV